MDKQEMDKALAEVMGWVVQAHDIEPPFDFWWHNENDWPTVKISLWHPTKSWDQMMMCVEKVNDCLHYKQHGEKGTPCAMFCGAWPHWVSNKDPILAIGEAILRAEGKWEGK